METTEGVTFLDRGAMLNASDEKYEIVDAPEWGGKVRIKALTSTERDAWESTMTREIPDPLRKGKTKWVPNAENVRAKLVVRCVVDAEGKRIFSDGDIPFLGNKSAAIVDRIYARCVKLSGISQEDVDEMEGNSAAAPSANSSGISA